MAPLPRRAARLAAAASAASLALLALAAVAPLAACGQKGPLYLPEADGSAAHARPVARRASMPADRASAAPLPPLSSTN